MYNKAEISIEEGEERGHPAIPPPPHSHTHLAINSVSDSAKELQSVFDTEG